MSQDRAQSTVFLNVSLILSAVVSIAAAEAQEKGGFTLENLDSVVVTGASANIRDGLSIQHDPELGRNYNLSFVCSY